MPTGPIDPTTATPYGLEGKVVTMDAARTVLDRGVVYIRSGRIVDVRPTAAPPPPGCEGAAVVATGGTIYPGLIELHNHLSYDILPLWAVPTLFRDRGQWKDHPDKRKLITAPMQVLGKTPHYVEAIVRYVEGKCLLSGVTTSQGIKLYGIGIDRYYRGLVRNVEATDDPGLPEAESRIADVEAGGAPKLLKRLNAQLKQHAALLLHLAEGIPDTAEKYFKNLAIGDDKWAINAALAGIHCVGLKPEDFAVMKSHDAAVVWSPFSNLLLYGATLDLPAVRAAGLPVALGSDWSPSGSRNLLEELKVAHLVNQEMGAGYSAADLVAMATCDAARIVKWDQAVGSLQPGLLADLVVVDGRQERDYERLIEARETDIHLVVIDGVPRCGVKTLMERFARVTEELALGSWQRSLNLDQAVADPVVGALRLGDARNMLMAGLGDLPHLAQVLEDGGNAFALAGVDAGGAPNVFLDLDLDAPEEAQFRANLDAVRRAGRAAPTALLAPLGADTAYSDLLAGVDIALDPLTVAGDEGYFDAVIREPNLPAYVRENLPGYYGASPHLPDGISFLGTADRAIQARLAASVALPEFVARPGYLTLDDRKRIVEQALVLFEQVYVHLPEKRAMHAVEPVQRLRLLRYELGQQTEASPGSELEFHKALTRVFASVRDLHTNYLLPVPYRDSTAYLPFLIEQYHDGDDRPRYIVSKVLALTGPDNLDYLKEAEVLYWNGVPIHQAVELNAERQAGSNSDARFARGLDALTIRPLVRALPPDEEWVTLRYRLPTTAAGEPGEERETRYDWLVFPSATGLDWSDLDQDGGVAAALGFDLQTDAIHDVKKTLFAPGAVVRQDRIAAGEITRASVNAGEIATTMPTVFRAKPVPTAHGTFAYVRIFTFSVTDAAAFVDEFVRLVRLLPQDGLIVDVRGNGGGLIYAAERLLQVLTPNDIEPEPAQFINTPLTHALCARNAPSPQWPDFSLRDWVESVGQSVQTGTTHSLGFPITPKDDCNRLGQQYFGPVVLVTDALCYSATDMFAAGFQDHDVGVVLGISGNTGAGGANVWTHGLLTALMADAPDSPFQPLPKGADMRVAVRRTLRVRRHAGEPVEDLGVVPGVVHRMTSDDVLHGNVDLIEAAAENLAGRPSYGLSPQFERVGGTTATLTVDSRHLTRLDVYVEGHPLGSWPVVDGINRLTLTLPAGADPLAPLALRLEGFAESVRVAVRRLIG
jgi:cytosine/adenosine deaminase-related metal-dependent hydrolase